MCILKVLHNQWLTLFRLEHHKRNTVMYLNVQWIILLLNYMALFVKSCSLADIAYWPAYYMARPFVLMKRNTLLNVLFTPPPSPQKIATFFCHFLAIHLLGYDISKEYVILWLVQETFPLLCGGPLIFTVKTIKNIYKPAVMFSD